MKMFSITTVKFSSFHSRFFRIQIHPIHKPIPEIQRQTLRIVYVSTDQHLADPATWNGSMGTGEWKYGSMEVWEWEYGSMGMEVWNGSMGVQEWNRSMGVQEWKNGNTGIKAWEWEYGDMGMKEWEWEYGNRDHSNETRNTVKV